MSNQSYDFNLSVGISELLDMDSAAKVESQVEQQKKRMEKPVEIKVNVDIGEAKQRIQELQKSMTIAANNIKKIRDKKSGLVKADYDALSRYNDALKDGQREINSLNEQLNLQGVKVKNNTKAYRELQDVLEEIGYVEKKKKTSAPRKQATSEVKKQTEAEKERVSDKETILDLYIDEMSTELEAINTEIQSIQSLIDDAISSVFDWGSG